VFTQAAAQRTTPEAASALTVALRAVLKCDRVVLSLLDDEQLRLVAGSDGFENLSRDLQADTVAAMEEALEDQGSFTYPVPAGLSRVEAAHARLCNQRELLAACTVPLAFDNQPAGALMALRERARPFTDQDLLLVEAVASLLGPWLALRRKADETWLRRLVAANEWAWQKSSQGRYRLLGVTAALAATVFLAWPVQREIVAPVKLEGAVQRVIAAPGDNYIRKVAARPGDMVKSGDVLIEFDVEDLRVERQRVMAAQTYNDAAAGDAMAKNDAAGLAQYQAKLEEGKAQLALLDQRLERGTVMAPFDAVVIEGDLSNALGAPTKKGEKLMVLAPAEAFRAIVEIPDDDIAHVKEGQSGQMVLTALPNLNLPMRLKRVIPLAVVNDGRSYFEGEVAITGATPDSLKSLRPGMRGISRLEAGLRARGLVWFDEVRAWCRFAWWRWVG
jgi:multidrug resistance efflux pump